MPPINEQMINIDEYEVFFNDKGKKLKEIKNEINANQISFNSKLEVHLFDTTKDNHIEFSSFFKTTTNLREELFLFKKNLKKYKQTQVNDLKKKKIGGFKNFIIKIFTFGQKDKNKDIKNKIKKFKTKCKEIKVICNNLILNLKNNEQAVITEIAIRHEGIIIERNNLNKEIIKLQNQITKLQIQNKLLNSDLNSALQKITENELLNSDLNSALQIIKELSKKITENENEITDLKNENQAYQDFIKKDNENFTTTYIIQNKKITLLETKVLSLENKVTSLEKKLMERKPVTEECWEATIYDEINALGNTESKTQKEQQKILNP